MKTENAQKRAFDDIGDYVGAVHCGSGRVGQILDTKGHEVHTIAPSATVLEGLRMMSRHGIGALVVVSGMLVEGIFSERDYARKIILAGKSSRETTVGEIMSVPASTVTPQHTVAECMEMMTEKRVRHLPVLDRGHLVGLISIGDLVKSIISEQGQRIEQLERYIVGSYPT